VAVILGYLEISVDTKYRSLVEYHPRNMSAKFAVKQISGYGESFPPYFDGILLKICFCVSDPKAKMVAIALQI
jgi:hypothetical protein